MLCGSALMLGSASGCSTPVLTHCWIYEGLMDKRYGFSLSFHPCIRFRLYWWVMVLLLSIWLVFRVYAQSTGSTSVFTVCLGQWRYNFVVNAGVEGFWFAQLTMCSSLVCNLVFLWRSALCSGNSLVPCYSSLFAIRAVSNNTRPLRGQGFTSFRWVVDSVHFQVWLSPLAIHGFASC